MSTDTIRGGQIIPRHKMSQNGQVQKQIVTTVTEQFCIGRNWGIAPISSKQNIKVN